MPSTKEILEMLKEAVECLEASVEEQKGPELTKVKWDDLVNLNMIMQDCNDQDDFNDAQKIVEDMMKCRPAENFSRDTEVVPEVQFEDESESLRLTYGSGYNIAVYHISDVHRSY